MDAKARNCLLQYREALEKDIKTSYIMDRMINDGVLTISEEEKVKNEPTQQQRAALLIKTILKKDNYSYISFYNALIHEGYKDLAALLHSGIPVISSSNGGKDSVGGITSHVKTVLCEGGVPQRPVVFVTRKKLVNAIRQNLFKLSDEPGWVVIYGMAGCGKSVLAAEAVRDHFFLDDFNHPFMRERERERQGHRQKEKQAPCKEPNMGLHPGTPESLPGPEAGAKVLSHPGIPAGLSSFGGFRENPSPYIL